MNLCEVFIRRPIATSLLMLGRYSDVYYEDSELGSQELLGSLALVRALTRASSLSLNASVRSTEQDNSSLALDYDEYEGYLSYQLEAARTTIVFDAGYTELHFADLTSDGYLVRLELIRRLSASSELHLTGGREFANSADLFRQVQQGGVTDPSTQPVQAVANPFESTYGTIDWLFERNRTRFGLGVGYFQEDYELTDVFNRDRLSYRLLAGRELSRAFGVNAVVTYSDESYDELDREFAETMADVSLDWRFGRRVYASLTYRWIDRSDDLTPANEFDESQIWLLFGYTRSGQGSRIGGPMLTAIGQGAR